jgi:hypothetical protein
MFIPGERIPFTLTWELSGNKPKMSISALIEFLPEDLKDFPRMSVF